MKWLGRRSSSNVEDRRGMSTGKLVTGGGIVGVVFLLIQMFLGGDSSEIFNQVQNQVLSGGGGGGEQRELSEAEKKQGQFASVVFADTEDVWGKIFAEQGQQYQQPNMVLFTDGVQTECGGAS